MLGTIRQPMLTTLAWVEGEFDLYINRVRFIHCTFCVHKYSQYRRHYNCQSSGASCGPNPQAQLHQESFATSDWMGKAVTAFLCQCLYYVFCSCAGLRATKLHTNTRCKWKSMRWMSWSWTIPVIHGMVYIVYILYMYRHNLSLSHTHTFFFWKSRSQGHEEDRPGSTWFLQLSDKRK